MKTPTGPRPWVGALFIFLAPAAGAQEEEEALKLAVSGRIEMTGAWRDRAVNEASLWTPGGLPPGSLLRRSDTLVLPDLAVRLDLEGPFGKAAFEAGNQPLEFDSADTRLQDARLGESGALEIVLRQAWVELFGAARFGLQPLRWDPACPEPGRGACPEPSRGAGRGHPLFLDPTGAESPWGELPDATVPPFPAMGTNTVPQTRRDGLHPAGLTARLEDLTMFALVMVEGGSAAEDEGLAGAAWSPDLGAFRPGLIAAILTGGGRARRVGTVGGALSWVSDPWTLSAEAYLQFGRTGRLDADGDGGQESLLAEGSALRISARYAAGFQAEVMLVWVSGDEEGTDGREGRFLSYENNDATLIVEGNEFGLDIDTNYRSVQISAGFEAEALGLRLQPRLLAALFALNEKVPLPPDPAFGVSGRSDDLGLEVDLGLDIPWSESLVFSFAAGFLLGSGVLEEFTADGHDRTFLVTAGLRLRF